MSTEASRNRFVGLAEVARPHGVRGEVRLTVFNAESDLLLDQDEVLVRMPDGKEHEVSVDSARRADKAILMKLHSVDDRDRAEALRGATIGVRRDELPAPDEGEIYWVDLEGSEVRLKDERLGIVERVVEYPTMAAILVRRSDGTALEVPLVDGYVERVDVEGRVVVLSSIEGLE